MTAPRSERRERPDARQTARSARAGSAQARAAHRRRGFAERRPRARVGAVVTVQRGDAANAGSLRIRGAPSVGGKGADAGASDLPLPSKSRELKPREQCAHLCALLRRPPKKVPAQRVHAWRRRSEHAAVAEPACCCWSSAAGRLSTPTTRSAISRATRTSGASTRARCTSSTSQAKACTRLSRRRTRWRCRASCATF